MIIRMPRAHRWAIVSLLASLTFAGARADDPANTQPPEELIELTVDGAAEPIPAFRYHLLPPEEKRVRGNAAPIYTRIVHEKHDAWKKRLFEASDLLEPSFEEMPLDKAKKLLDEMADVTTQLHAAALRSDCDWEYVLEVGDPHEVLLNDAQFMRSYARLLVLKARYEMRTGDLPAALATIGDCLALGRHVANSPFVVSQLIGNAIAAAGVDELDRFVALHGAPNLYWAIATRPRPMISLLPGMQTEMRILVLKFPELADMSRVRTTEEWQRLARALREWGLKIQLQDAGLPAGLVGKPRRGATEKQLVAARAYLRDVAEQSAEAVAAMTDAEVEVRYTVALWAEFSNAWVKWLFVPYAQAHEHFSENRQDLKSEIRQRELYPLLSLIGPFDVTMLSVPARAERRWARLQAIEAIRMHAAATGSLPASLDEITVVPVPDDPATGAPFRYQLEDGAAVLDVAELAGMPRPALAMPVRIRLREAKTGERSPRQ